MRSIAGDTARGVALAGKAGVGKSRLAREAVAAAAAAGWTVREIAATATSRSVALGAFWQWTDGTETAPFALVRKVIETLTDDTQPDRLVVLVDDAHHLDELSALVLHQLVHSRAAAVIVTIRTGEPAPAAVTALWKDGLLRRYELEPLTRNEIDDLLAATLGAAPDRQCADKLWHLTRGNVLFLRQSSNRSTGRDGWWPSRAPSVGPETPRSRDRLPSWWTLRSAPFPVTCATLSIWWPFPNPLTGSACAWLPARTPLKRLSSAN